MPHKIRVTGLDLQRDVRRERIKSRHLRCVIKSRQCSQRRRDGRRDLAKPFSLRERSSGTTHPVTRSFLAVALSASSHPAAPGQARLLYSETPWPPRGVSFIRAAQKDTLVWVSLPALDAIVCTLTPAIMVTWLGQHAGVGRFASRAILRNDTGPNSVGAAQKNRSIEFLHRQDAGLSAS
jgi:hypothetical protein